ncbi:hypothetical protein P8935_01660 [Telmatobacter sp. DSM 110680]|uniref:Uncharacterized protein n=1 Tax=Telmatobacter sp. DSM 110680 TaxID=3036704 RepID=A0AAU7DJM1_9BACT
MLDMSNTITREEFASAVASTIASTHHLYREVDRLITGLRDRLAEEPNSLAFLAGVFGKAGRDQTRRIIRNEYGALFSPAIGEDDEGDEDEDEIEDEGDEPEEELDHKPLKGIPAQIGANQPLLAVRIVMYDPQMRDSFEPQVQYAVMNHWTVANKSWDAKEVFIVRKSLLKRIPRALGGSNLTRGSKLTTKATVKSNVGAKRTDGRQLCCVLPAGVETFPLYNLDTPEALEHLGAKMKLMWSSDLQTEN